MRVIYAGIDLGEVRTERFDVVSVLDPTGQDYLYSKYDLQFTGIVNGDVRVLSGFTPDTNDLGGDTPNLLGTPGIISYQRELAPEEYPELITEIGALPEGLRPDPVPDFPEVGVDTFGKFPETLGTPDLGVLGGELGITAANQRRLWKVRPAPNPAVLTLATIRHRLSTPRAPLYIFKGAGEGDDLILQTPEEGMRCDCRGGPIPKVLSCNPLPGDAETIEVTWSVEAYVNESAANGVLNPQALLSNKFIQRHVVDHASYLTIETQGEAHFRLDYVYKLKENPDAKRPLFFLPVPRGFIRENIEVEAMPGTLGVRYRFADRQVPTSFPAGPYVGAAGVNVLHRQAIVADKSITEGALAAYERVYGQIVNRRFAGDAPAARGQRAPRAPRNDGQPVIRLPTPTPPTP